MTDYLFHNAKLPGSGDYSLNVLLKPMAYAYKPLIQRIPKLKLNHIAILYGEHDWMDPQGGLDVQRICNEQDNCTTMPKIDIMIVPSAGHLLMLENWQDFNHAVIQAVLSMKHGSSYVKVDDRFDVVHRSKKVVHGEPEVSPDQSAAVPS